MWPVSRISELGTAAKQVAGSGAVSEDLHDIASTLLSLAQKEKPQSSLGLLDSQKSNVGAARPDIDLNLTPPSSPSASDELQSQISFHGAQVSAHLKPTLKRQRTQSPAKGQVKRRKGVAASDGEIAGFGHDVRASQPGASTPPTSHAQVATNQHTTALEVSQDASNLPTSSHARRGPKGPWSAEHRLLIAQFFDPEFGREPSWEQVSWNTVYRRFARRMNSAEFQHHVFARLQAEQAPDELIAKLRDVFNKPTSTWSRSVPRPTAHDIGQASRPAFLPTVLSRRRTPWHLAEKVELSQLLGLKISRSEEMADDIKWRRTYKKFSNLMQSVAFRRQILGKLASGDVSPSLDSRIRELLETPVPNKS